MAPRGQRVGIFADVRRVVEKGLAFPVRACWNRDGGDCRKDGSVNHTGPDRGTATVAVALPPKPSPPGPGDGKAC